jgi:hypothetical protein
LHTLKCLRAITSDDACATQADTTVLKFAVGPQWQGGPGYCTAANGLLRE